MKKSAGPTVKDIVKEFRPIVEALRRLEHDASGVATLLNRLSHDVPDGTPEEKALQRVGRANDKRFKQIVGSVPAGSEESEATAYDVRVILNAIKKLSEAVGIDLDCSTVPFRGAAWTVDVTDYDFEFDPKQHKLNTDGTVRGYRRPSHREVQVEPEDERLFNIYRVS